MIKKNLNEYEKNVRLKNSRQHKSYDLTYVYTHHRHLDALRIRNNAVGPSTHEIGKTLFQQNSMY